MTTRRSAVLLEMATVEAVPVSWLWPNRLPLGKLVIIDGDPGNGKSMLTLDIAARVSLGSSWPDGTQSDLTEPAGVVLVCAEDAAADTLRPRLDAAGADTNRIAVLDGVKGTRDRDAEPFVLDHLDALEDAVTSKKARLVVVDPLMAFLPVHTNSHNDQHVRQILTPLGKLAERLGVTVLVVRHLNKSSEGRALTRGGGSMGIIGASRMAHLVAPDPTDPTGAIRAFAATKTNVGRPPETLLFRIVTSGLAARIEWCGGSELTPEDLVRAPPGSEGGTALANAATTILEALADGPLTAADLQRVCLDRGLSDRTTERVRAKLAKEGRITRAPGGFGKEWVWRCTEQASGPSTLPQSSPFPGMAETAKTGED
jgi:hypothetical protein